MPLFEPRGRLAAPLLLLGLRAGLALAQHLLPVRVGRRLSQPHLALDQALRFKPALLCDRGHQRRVLVLELPRDVRLFCRRAVLLLLGQPPEVVALLRVELLHAAQRALVRLLLLRHQPFQGLQMLRVTRLLRLLALLALPSERLQAPLQAATPSSRACTPMAREGRQFLVSSSLVPVGSF